MNQNFGWLMVSFYKTDVHQICDKACFWREGWRKNRIGEGYKGNVNFISKVLFLLLKNIQGKDGICWFGVDICFTKHQVCWSQVLWGETHGERVKSSFKTATLLISALPVTLCGLHSRRTLTLGPWKVWAMEGLSALISENLTPPWCDQKSE